MADFNNVTGDVFVPEVWSAKSDEVRTADYWMADRIERWDEDATSYGDKIHRPRVGNMTARPVGSTDGSVSPQALTQTEVTIDLTSWYEITFRITDRLMKQSKYGLTPIFMKMAGKGLAEQIETDCLGLWSGLSTNVLTAQDDFDEDFILAATTALDAVSVPQDDRFGLIRHTQKARILKIDRLVSFQHIGPQKSGSAIIKGQLVYDIHGVEWKTTPLIPVSTTYKNMCFHRSAFVLAVQKGVKWDELAKDGKRRTFSGDELYGFGESRDDHAVIMPTVN
jgi:hypothetical protein